MAGVTDDTIFQMQPSNNEPSEMTDNQGYMTKNSNFKSMKLPGKNQTPQTVRQEKEIVDKIEKILQNVGEDNFDQLSVNSNQ